MAQVIYCDQCDTDAVAFIVVSFYGTPVTEAVCLGCLPQWLVDLTGALKAQLPPEVVEQLLAAMAAAAPPGEPVPADPAAPAEAPEAPAEAPQAPAAFPGTRNVVRSTHGHRKTRSAPPEDPEAADSSAS